MGSWIQKWPLLTCLWVELKFGQRTNGSCSPAVSLRSTFERFHSGSTTSLPYKRWQLYFVYGIHYFGG